MGNEKQSSLQLAETDRLALELAITKSKLAQLRLSLASREATNAQTALQQEEARLRREYGLQDQDRITVETGEIARVGRTG